MNAIELYKKYFPYAQPNLFQLDLIEASITDLAIWQETLEFWAGNDYRAQSVFKMIEYYKELKAPKKFDPGANTEPVINDLPDCLECDNQRWIYPEGDWRKAYKCPACSQEAIAA